jgi:hypothetical protein
LSFNVSGLAPSVIRAGFKPASLTYNDEALSFTPPDYIREAVGLSGLLISLILPIPTINPYSV